MSEILRGGFVVSSAGVEPAFPPSEGGVLSVIRRGRFSFLQKTGRSAPVLLCEETSRARIFRCAWQESDLRPSGPQPDALSTELQAQTAHGFPYRESIRKTDLNMQQFLEDVNHAWVTGFFLKVFSEVEAYGALIKIAQGNMYVGDESAPGMKGE